MALFEQPFNFVGPAPVIKSNLQLYLNLLYNDLNNIIGASVAAGTANTLAYYTSTTAIGSLSAITASRALASNASGLPVASATTATELAGLNGLTASRAIVTTAGGILTAATTTATEIGYVNGVTSAIQTQLNTKAADSAVVHNTGNESVAGIKTFSSGQVVSLTTTGGTDLTFQTATGPQHAYIETFGASTAVVTSLSANRTYNNGGTGVSNQTGQAASSIRLFASNADSSIQFATTASNNANPTVRLTIAASGLATFANNVIVSGTTNLIGVTTVGDTVTSDTNNTDDLGTSSVGWKDLYLEGSIKDGSTVTITPLATGVAIRGTTTNDSAATGFVGEYVASVQGTNQAAPATDQFFDVTSISLTAGDWDVWIIAAVNSADYTQISDQTCGIGTVSGNTDPGTQLNDRISISGTPGKINQAFYKRMSLTSTTTVYLKMYITYSAGTHYGIGKIWARRVR